MNNSSAFALATSPDRAVTVQDAIIAFLTDKGVPLASAKRIVHQICDRHETIYLGMDVNNKNVGIGLPVFKNRAREIAPVKNSATTSS